MIWRNDHERAGACRAVLQCVRLAHLWTYEGPTKQAVKYITGCPLSHGETIMLKLAWTLWNGADFSYSGGHYDKRSTRWRFDIAEAMGTLDGERMAVVARVVTAIASDRHELMTRFIEESEARERRQPITLYINQGRARGSR